MLHLYVNMYFFAGIFGLRINTKEDLYNYKESPQVCRPTFRWLLPFLLIISPDWPEQWFAGADWPRAGERSQGTKMRGSNDISHLSAPNPSTRAHRQLRKEKYHRVIFQLDG